MCLAIQQLEKHSCPQLTVSKVLSITPLTPLRVNSFDIILALNPYIYTTGRWLNHEKSQRESRYIQIDFAALCRKVVELCQGAGRVVRYEKKEREFNRSFIIFMGDGIRVVAILPTRIAGPRRLTTNSEVATMTYC